ncbi:hypothetical protein Q2941_47900 [Bradyrhizobium sp. UFLA05-153]
MTDIRKPTSSERKVRFEGRVLSNDELEAVSGGLGSAVSEVLKNFGGALNTSARGS